MLEYSVTTAIVPVITDVVIMATSFSLGFLSAAVVLLASESKSESDERPTQPSVEEAYERGLHEGRFRRPKND